MCFTTSPNRLTASLKHTVSTNGVACVKSRGDCGYSSAAEHHPSKLSVASLHPRCPLHIPCQPPHHAVLLNRRAKPARLMDSNWTPDFTWVPADSGAPSGAAPCPVGTSLRAGIHLHAPQSGTTKKDHGRSHFRSEGLPGFSRAADHQNSNGPRARVDRLRHSR